MKLFVLSHSSYNVINMIVDHEGFLDLVEKHISSIQGLILSRDENYLGIRYNTKRYTKQSIVESFANFILKNGFVVEQGKIIDSDYSEIGNQFVLEEDLKDPNRFAMNDELLSINFSEPPSIDSLEVLQPIEMIYHEPAFSLVLTNIGNLAIGFYGNKIGSRLQFIHSAIETQTVYTPEPLDKCIDDQCIVLPLNSITNDFCPLVELLEPLLISMGYVRSSAKLEENPSDNLQKATDSLGIEFVNERLWNYNQVEIIYTHE